jgi:predicted RNA-binding Zn-ribbon protein involved in translation (DUF1610 family)
VPDRVDFFDAWSAFEVAVTVRKYLPCVPSLRNISGRRVVDAYQEGLSPMSHELTAARPVNFRCPTCGTPAKNEVPAKFECMNCGQTIQVTVATGRVKGPIVWLAGDSRSPD